MKKSDTSTAGLRRQAEEKLRARKKKGAPASATKADAQRLIHELEVHQIELELQNEELIRAKTESETARHQYTDLYDSAPVGYFTLKRDGTILMSNLPGADLLNVERGKLLKRRFGVFVSIESRPAFNGFLEQVFASGKHEFSEILLLKGGQESCWVRLDAICAEDRQECRVVMKDIHAQAQADAHFRALSRTLALLGDVNQTIVRVREPQALLEAACRIAVEKGGFCMAWVGLVEPQTKQVKPVAHAGNTDGYLEKLNIMLDDSARGSGPTASALRSGGRVVVNDIASDPRMAPWRADALRLGYRASAAFPLIVAGNVRGTLNLYAPEPDFFNAAELKVLDEMTADIAFALDFSEQEQQRKKTDELLRASLRLSEYALSHSLDELLTKTLDEAELLTGSQIGFFHFLEADQKTLWLQSWSTNTLQKMCNAEGKDQHYSVDKAGVWVDCIRERRPVIHNDYASLPHRKGLPQGHAPVARELVVPILRGEKIMGILGVGNKLGEYNEQDIEVVSRLANLTWEIVFAKQAEEALIISKAKIEESEIKFNAITNQTTEGIALSDLNGNYKFVNPAFCLMTGYSETELLTKTVYDLKAETQPPGSFVESKTTREGLPIEVTLRRKDKTEFDTEIIGKIIKIGGQEFVLGTVREITERKEAEAALRKSEERYRLLYENVPVMNFTVDETGKVLAANHFSVEQLGYSVEELVGQPMINVFHSQDRPVVRRQLKECFQNPEQVFEWELRKVHKDGHLLWVHETARVLKEKDHPVLLIACQNITERVRAEEEIRQRHEDLALINTINAAANRGESLPAIAALISDEASRIFNGLGATLHLINAQRDRLVMQNLTIPPEIRAQIEKWLGMPIPLIQHDLHQAHPFRQVLENKQAYLVTESSQIREYIRAYVESLPLPAKARAGLRKFVPALNKLLGVRSRIVIPLISGDEVIGTLDIGSLGIFTEDDLRRMESVAGQLTAVIERKRAEEALKESQQSYQRLVEQIPGVIYRDALDEKASTLFISQQIKDLTGYAPEEWQVDPDLWLKLVHPDDRPRVLTENKHHLATGEPFRSDYRLLARDGRIVWVRDEAISIRDSSGQPLYDQGVFTDITERKQAEETLRDAEERYRKLVETSPDGIVIVGLDGKISYCSPKILEIFGGRQQSEIIGHTPLEWIAVEDQERAALDMRNVFKGMYSPNNRYQLLKTDGSIFWGEINSAVLTDAQGNPAAMICVIRDVTEKVRAEEEYRTVISTAMDGFWITDAQGYFLDVNDAYCQLIGYSREELLEMGVRDVEVLEETEEIVRHIQKVIKNGFDRFETCHRCKNGTVVDIEISVNFRSEFGGRFYVFLRDITERKQAEEERARLVKILESSLNEIYIFDAETLKFSYANFGVRKNTGYSIEQMQSMTPLDLKPEFTETSFREIIRPLLLDEMKVEVFETIHRRADGTEYPVEVHLQLVESGGVRSFLALINDISERKAVEEALHDVQTRMQHIIASSPAVLYSITPDFAANWVAQNVEFILGYTVAESLAPGWWADHLHPDDRQHVFTGLPRVFEDGKHAHEYRFQFKDGSYHWIHDELRLTRDAQGNPTEIIGAWHDVSERKQAEAELNKLREAVDTSGEVIFMTDRQGLITFVNPEFSRLYGYNADEVIGKTTPRILKGGSAKPEDYARLWQAILNRQIVKGEFTNKTRDGRLLTIEGSINPIFDEQDEIVGFLAIQRDITARKQAEIELQENEERFRRLISENADGIAVLDEAGTIIFVNPAAQTLFNRPAQELLGMPLGIPVGDSNAIVELNLPHGDQDEVNTEVRFVASQWAGQPAYIATLRDVTERRQTEETMRLQSSTLAAASNSIVITDRGGTIQWVNPAFTYLTGYSLEEAIGQNPRLLKSGRQDTAFYEQVWRTILDGQVWRGEIINRRKDGSLYNEEMTITPVRETGGEITHFIAVKQDITARVQAQADMRQRMAELEALHTVSAALRVAQTRNEALSILLDEILAALETDAGAIWLYQAASDELQVAVARGWFNKLSQKTLKPGQGIAGTVFASGESHLAADFATDPLALAANRSAAPAGWSGVCLPIRSGSATVGTLFISVPPPRQITSDQMKLLASLAALAGSTLHRMSLHEETERRLGQLQALHNIDRAITTSMDLRMTLKILLEHVTTQLKVDAASVLLLNPHLHTLEYTEGLGFRSSAIQMAHIRLGESFAGRAALERRTIEVSDPAMLGEDTQFATMFANEGFETYYGIPLSAKGQVKGVLEIYHRSPLAPAPEWLEFLETLAGQAAIAIDNMQLFDGLQRSNVELELAYDTTLEGWSKALELRDQETEGHSQRVTEMTLRLARTMGIAEAEIANVRRGALLHDMGKMGVPDSILLKPGKLTDEEWVIMRKHPQYVFDMLSPIAYLRPALDIPYCHHEKWDGTGYPRGLKGEQIPLAARIFAIIDVWDALTSDRPYRKAWTKKKTLEYIGEQSGTHFDPKVVNAFLKVIREA